MRATCGTAAAAVYAIMASFVFQPMLSKAVFGQVGGGTPPATLGETGLHIDFAALKVDPHHLAFAPQYPLWSDGATKRRWISIPPGTSIDASDPEAWTFPVGTRFWKEFSFDGRPVETRYMERLPDGRWLYASYAWSADGRNATLVSERGRRNVFGFGSGRSHTIPGVTDCKVCHQGGRTEVLGFSALQLSPDRDPAAPHAEPRPLPAVDLDYLVAQGLVKGLPRSFPAVPSIAARSRVERAALGYLHANCGHCHNDNGPLANLGFSLRQVLGAPAQPALATAVGQPVKKRAPAQSTATDLRISPRHPDRSALVERMASRYPLLQMPPLGTELVDEDALATIRRWIAEMQQPGTDSNLEQQP